MIEAGLSWEIFPIMAGFFHMCGEIGLLLADLGWLTLDGLDDWDGWDDSALCRMSGRIAHIYSHGMAEVHGHHTRNGNTQVPFKFLIANVFANIWLVHTNYRIRVGRTIKLQGRGYNLARLLTGVIAHSVYHVPPFPGSLAFLPFSTSHYLGPAEWDAYLAPNPHHGELFAAWVHSAHLPAG